MAKVEVTQHPMEKEGIQDTLWRYLNEMVGGHQSLKDEGLRWLGEGRKDCGRLGVDRYGKWHNSLFNVCR